MHRSRTRKDLNQALHITVSGKEATSSPPKPATTGSQADLAKMDAENLMKQFTRFFVPGLSFLVFAVLLPTTALGKDLFFGKDPAIGLSQAILLSVVAGYVMDSIKGYRWTLSFKHYNAERASLAKALTAATRAEAPNPDDLIAVLWKRDEPSYNRIFVERAEWVMILETAFAMLLSAAVLLCGGTYLSVTATAPHWSLWLLPPALFATWQFRAMDSNPWTRLALGVHVALLFGL